MRRVLATLLLCAAVPSGDLAAGPEFPLKTGVNRRHLVDHAGTPFLYHADTPWMLFTKLTEAEAKDYIAPRTTTPSPRWPMKVRSPSAICRPDAR